MLKVLIDHYEFPATDIVVIPKPYSTVPQAEEELNELAETFGLEIVSSTSSFKPGCYDDVQQSVLRDACKKLLELVKKARNEQEQSVRVIVVDDGGLITTTWNAYCRLEKIDTISIQHTTSGVGRRPHDVPKIDVARSAAKRHFESNIIAESIIRKVESLEIDLLPPKTTGIAGLGAVGGALARSLREKLVRSLRDKGATLIGLEKAAGRAPSIDGVDHVYTSRRDFLERSDIIFGCTGTNWTSGISAAHLFSGKTFISCSSRDVEFKWLLEQHAPDGLVGSYDDITLTLHPSSTVLNAGFPINFDRTTEHESFQEIALTRSLVLHAIAIATFLERRQDWGDPVMFPPDLQQQIVKEWLKETGLRSAELGVPELDMARPEWWKESSGGSLYG